MWAGVGLTLGFPAAGAGSGIEPWACSQTIHILSLCLDPLEAPSSFTHPGLPTLGLDPQMSLVSPLLTASSVPFSKQCPARWVLSCLPAEPAPTGARCLFSVCSGTWWGPRLWTHQGTGGARCGHGTLLGH